MLGLQPNFFQNFFNLKKFVNFSLVYSWFWLLMVANLIFNHEKLSLYKFVIFVAVFVNVVRSFYYLTMKTRILNLQIKLSEVFSDDESKTYLDAAEKRLRKVFCALVLLMMTAIVVTVTDSISADELLFPLFKPKSWNFSGTVRFAYIIIQSSCTFYGYSVLWIFNLTVINFLVYLQEYSKLIKSKFETMKSKKDLKTCVTIHLNFKA